MLSTLGRETQALVRLDADDGRGARDDSRLPTTLKATLRAFFSTTRHQGGARGGSRVPESAAGRQPRSAEISQDQLRSAEISRDQPSSAPSSKKTARSRLRGAERTHHTDMGPAPSRSVTCPLLQPSTRHALMAERVTTCSCIHRHGKSVLVLHLCRRDHARSCLCVPAVALRRLCSCSGVAVERHQCQSILGDAM